MACMPAGLGQSIQRAHVAGVPRTTTSEEARGWARFGLRRLRDREPCRSPCCRTQGHRKVRYGHAWVVLGARA
eukprot:364174-Pleurochrysis_carterae.AAC.1